MVHSTARRIFCRRKRDRPLNLNRFPFRRRSPCLRRTITLGTCCFAMAMRIAWRIRLNCGCHFWTRA